MVLGWYSSSPLLQFSQLLEEKNTLSIQLSDASQSLRENQHHYSDLSKHCAVLEKQVQELQAVRQWQEVLRVIARDCCFPTQWKALSLHTHKVSEELPSQLLRCCFF